MTEDVTVDTEAGVAYIRLAHGIVSRTTVLSDTVNADLDQTGAVLGVELLSLGGDFPYTKLVDLGVDRNFLESAVETIEVMSDRETVTAIKEGVSLDGGPVDTNRLNRE